VPAPQLFTVSEPDPAPRRNHTVANDQDYRAADMLGENRQQGAEQLGLAAGAVEGAEIVE